MNQSEIENAIYFDFESNPNKPPSIAGWLYKDLDSGTAISRPPLV